MIVLDEELLINPRDSSPFDAHGPVVEGIDSKYFACAVVPILSHPLFALHSTGGVLTMPPSSSSSCIPLTMACGVLSPYTAPPPADLHGMGSKGIPAPTPSATSGAKPDRVPLQAPPSALLPQLATSTPTDHLPRHHNDPSLHCPHALHPVYLTTHRVRLPRSSTVLELLTLMASLSSE